MIRSRSLALLLGALCALMLAGFSTPLQAQSRPVALVIGESYYLKLGKLEKKANDMES